MEAAGITEGPVFRRIWLPRRSTGQDPPPLPRIGAGAITLQTVAQIVQSRAMAAGSNRRELGGHSLKRGALTTGMDAGVHPTRLKRLGRHKSFDVLGDHLEFGDLLQGIRSVGFFKRGLQGWGIPGRQLDNGAKPVVVGCPKP